MDLGHPWGCNWHDDVSQKISVIIGGKCSGVHSVADEAIIEVALSLVHVSLVVVPERELREVAVEVEHDVAININEEVALALLAVDEAMHLIALVQVVGLTLLKGLLVLGTGISGLDLGLVVLIGILEAEEFYCTY